VAYDVLLDAGPTAYVDRCRRRANARIVCVGGWRDAQEECRQRLVVKGYSQGRGAIINVHTGPAHCRGPWRRVP
jgi:hypothetical protein